MYLAVAASELGDAFHYIAVMWFALLAAGPLGIVAVRLADSVPALLFGLHGGVIADRFDRRRTLIVADLARAAALLPVAVAALTDRLPLWGLAVAAFFLTGAATYFAPAYGSLLPALVGRENVQRANGLVRASVDAISVGGWALAAALLTVVPFSAFFALNAVTFLMSAMLLSSVRTRSTPATDPDRDGVDIRGGLTVLRAIRPLAAAAVVLAIAMTLSEGAWMVGVPELIRENLSRGAGAFSLVMVGWAVGSIIAGVLLARRQIGRKPIVAMLAWSIQMPGYLLIAFASSVAVAFAGAVLTGLAHGGAEILLTSAVQEQVPDRVLGRVLGVVSLIDRGAHATGLMFIGPLFAFFAPTAVFVAVALALPIVGLAGAAYALAPSRRAA